MENERHGSGLWELRCLGFSKENVGHGHGPRKVRGPDMVSGKCWVWAWSMGSAWSLRVVYRNPVPGSGIKGRVGFGPGLREVLSPGLV